MPGIIFKKQKHENKANHILFISKINYTFNLLNIKNNKQRMIKWIQNIHIKIILK